MQALPLTITTSEVDDDVLLSLDGVTAISLEAPIVNPDEMEMLEDLLIAGVNKALEEAEGIRTRRMQEAASTMLPPGLDLGGMGGGSGPLI